MDFARKQLEKYGWTDGKGLGKHENGIAQALKPKLKRSVTGVGHDAASDFTEHWWTTLYNKAAGNVEVEEENGKTKKIKTKDSNNFEITNSTWRLNKKSKEPNGEYGEYFVKKAILNNGGVDTEKVESSDSSDEDVEKKDVFKMTDEELFAACEGRTAHKGARFGLKATGKLERIKQQEELLLKNSKYNGYSHSKNKNIEMEDLNLNSDTETKIKKRKKKKHCYDTDKANTVEAELVELVPQKRKKKNQVTAVDLTLTGGDFDKGVSEISSKSRKDKRKSNEVLPNCNEIEGDSVKKKKKKKRKDV